MTNSEHVEILRRGPRIWNAWRAENPSAVPDLTGISLSIGDRQMGPMNGGPINLSLSRLTGATLNFATLTGADMRGADLINADLRGARLEDVDLTGADLAGAQLDGASLAGACLKTANLCGASLADVRGLTAEQINEADGDLGTVLPYDLECPLTWTVGQGAFHREAAVEERDERSAEPETAPFESAPAYEPEVESEPEREAEAAREPEPQPEPKMEPAAKASEPEPSNPLRRFFSRSTEAGSSHEAEVLSRPKREAPRAPQPVAPEPLHAQTPAVEQSPPVQQTMTSRPAANGHDSYDSGPETGAEGENRHVTWLVGGPRRVGRRDRPGHHGNWRDRA